MTQIRRTLFVCLSLRNSYYSCSCRISKSRSYTKDELKKNEIYVLYYSIIFHFDSWYQRVLCWSVCYFLGNRKMYPCFYKIALFGLKLDFFWELILCSHTRIMFFKSKIHFILNILYLLPTAKYFCVILIFLLVAIYYQSSMNVIVS